MERALAGCHLESHENRAISTDLGEICSRLRFHCLCKRSAGSLNRHESSNYRQLASQLQALRAENSFLRKKLKMKKMVDISKRIDRWKPF
jgi:hypothetical protein